MGRAPRGSDSGYWEAPCSPTSGKSPHWVPAACDGGWSAQGPLGTCAPQACSVRVPTGCHGASTSLLTWRVHLRNCVCAHHAACLAVHVMHAHLCAHTRVQVHVCGVPDGVCQWVRTCSGPGPGPGVLARQVCGPREPVCPAPFAVSACSSWLPAGVCVLYLPVAGRVLGAGLQSLC